MSPPDPVDRLRDTIGHVERYITDMQEQGQRARRSEANRLALLAMHGIAATVIAPLFALSPLNGPAWVITRQIPGAPWTLAALLGAGGLTLLVSVSKRALRWEIAGLVLLACWYLTMAVGFAAAIGVWLTTGRPEPRPGLYAPMVYLHLFSVMSIHVYTLRRALRGRG